MVGANKSALAVKNGRQTRKFKSFSLRDKEGLTATESKNCDCRDGRLRAGVGYEICYEYGKPLVFDMEDIEDTEVLGVYPLRFLDGSNALFFVSGDGQLYAAPSVNEVYGVLVGEYPKCLSMRTGAGESYHIFVGSRGGFCTTDAIRFAELTDEPLYGACIAGHRLFLLYEDGRLEYSEAYAPTVFDGSAHAGGALFPTVEAGKPIAVAGYGEYVYIFFERGIFRITVKAKANEFTIEPIFYDGGEIIPRSALSLGAGIFFLAEGGAYRIRGERVERLCAYLPVCAKRGVSAEVGYCGNLALIDYEEESGERRRLVLYADGEEGFFTQSYGRLGGNDYLYDGAMKRLARGEGGVFPTQPYFQSGFELLGTTKRKTLKSLRFQGKGNLEVEVSTNGGSYRYALEMTEGERKIPVQIRGVAFSFRLIPSADCVVKRMDVEYVYADK